ncbi:MAG: DUF5693 family protein [Fimbriimonadaceae bacterium]
MHSTDRNAAPGFGPEDRRSVGLLTLAVVFAAVCAAASLVSLRARAAAESQNRSVEIAVEWEQVVQLAAGQRLSPAEALSKLREAGVGAVALTEQTVANLVDEGWLAPRAGISPETSAPGFGLVGDPETVGRVEAGLVARFGLDAVRRVSPEALAVSDPGVWSAVRGTAVALSPDSVAIVQAAGMRIVGRYANPVGASAEYVRHVAGIAVRQGVAVFLPVGDQVLGRRDNLSVLADALRASGIRYASPEFARIGGDANVLAMSTDNAVRLHAAQAVEIDRMSPRETVDRYVRAAQERSVRILLIRPLSLSVDDPVDAFAELSASIVSRLAKEGLTVGPAKPFADPAVPSWVFPVVGVSAGLAAALACLAVFGARVWTFFVAALPLIAGLSAATESGRGLAALMAAVAFPLIAFAVLDRFRVRFVPIAYLLVSALSLIGGLAVSGLLVGAAYTLRADQFTGVKFAHFLPIVAVGAYWLVRLTDARSAIRSPVTWAAGLGSIAGLFALAFMLARTGNDNPSAVSGLELQFRALLDQVLPVRPRTKEFLVGHPALFVGIGLLVGLRTGRRLPPYAPGLAVLMLTAGAIGQTSIVNTLCHLHTPLYIGFTRIGVGLLTGGILGAVAWWLLSRRWRKAEN